MAQDIRKVNDMESLITYFSEKLGWDIDLDDFYEIDDITYDFDADDLGLKQEAFAKITSLKQLRPLVDNQKWGIFFVGFDSQKFEVSALRKILSGLIPNRRNSAEHAVWNMSDLLFLCTWGHNNKVTIGAAYFEDTTTGLPQIKMISCEPAVEDFTQVNVFEQRLSKLHWPANAANTDSWREEWVSAFTVRYRQAIQDSHTLTVRLAEEAQRIRDNILNILDIETKNGYMHLLFEKFKNTLVHDMTDVQFADMYAQTIVYGLFSARCMDETQDDFSAVEAVDCIPNTNPFLKSLMQECLGSYHSKNKVSFDELEVGNIVELLMNTRTDAIIADFNRQTGGGREDPVIHFYEEFLTEYNKTQKVQRGVYYTPQPVVNFIVRAVDDILKSEFGIVNGLASTETKTIRVTRESKRKVDGFIRNVEVDKEVPAIQVLDPATGTGTFLRQTILQIYENFCNARKGKSKEKIQQEWNEYVPEHLLSRLNGFELMMAPYAVAHMKLAMVLKDTGYDFCRDKRLQVYLTNSLDEPGNSSKQITMFDDPLAFESVAANVVKKNSGINIVIGNPPYNVSSSNRSPWIMDLLADFKQGLTERKLNLDDDYIKFLKYAQNIIDISTNGILAFITNNSYIDGITHRRIRESLMASFDQVYVLDLHGNVMKQEKTASGGKDENIFDITQGVSICIFIKRKCAKKFVKHIDLMGIRSEKYDFLNKKSIFQIDWNELKPQRPEYLLIPYRYDLKLSYEKGFKVSELFSQYNSGIQTKCDELSVATSRRQLNGVIENFLNKSVSELKLLYPKKQDSSGWTFEKAKKEIQNGNYQITPYYYRPFDCRYTVYTGKSGGFIGRSREVVMQHIVGHPDNICLCMMKQFFQDTIYNHIFVSNIPIDERTLYSNRGGTYIFPLYKFKGSGTTAQKMYNFSTEIIAQIEKNLGLSLSKEKSSTTFTGEDIVAYIYAVLYNQTYREKYNDQLKYDFPSIPYPHNKEVFYQLVVFGNKLIKLHMPHSYYRDEDSKVIFDSLESYKFVGDKIVLNETLNIPAFEGVKDYQLGGYKPADKWLKDRKGKVFTESDLTTYQKLIASLIKTSEIMLEIDRIQF